MAECFQVAKYTYFKMGLDGVKANDAELPTVEIKLTRTRLDI
jgi:hypothetical protein